MVLRKEIYGGEIPAASLFRVTMTRSSVEGDVKDLQFGSLDWNKLGPLSSCDSCDVAVPTVVNVNASNADKFSPVESYKQQQTEEYSLSMMSRESYKQQTEEDALSTTSTIDYSYPEEEYLKEGEADDEEDLTPTEENKDEAPSGLSLEVSEWFDWWDMSDQRLERFISSCKVSDAGGLEASTWIHVYAYFNEKKLYGGYGVVVRNALREPIIASA
ncbi:hypothetical protein C5167_022967 [Papaver somniferum]|uniref:Uncharacterized protein n=1 Tax=Papaver somniferum TaxID=3469 RepID=A0A4Y7JMG3_PAPSO|nr:uncharacterized protein LOC113282025 [Papaver somniferum]RZC61212.1 hypothetical protein C5167_022967 [Papaver somniferum]